MNKEEQKLAEGLASGDESAYEVLFKEHFPFLKDMAQHLTGDEFVAKTIVGDFFFHIWEIRHDLRIGTSLRAYLARGVYNRCLNYMNSVYSKGKVELDESMWKDTEDPLGRILSKELEEEMNGAVESLPPETYRVFSMHRNEDKKYKEIASETGISVNTVKYHIKRALAMLRKTFGEYSGTLPKEGSEVSDNKNK
jgi:RNA polymerase sigma-70 factor (ECF subfamily)